MKSNRRKLLKALTLSGGVATAWKLPTNWSKPVVETVTLPAHAQTTSEPTSTLRQAASSGTSQVTINLHEEVSSGLFAANPDMLQRLMDVYLPKAHANGGLRYPADAEVYGVEKANGKWVFEIFLDYGALCESESTDVPAVCNAEVGIDENRDLYDALIQEAHADPIPTYTFQTLFTTDPLDVGELVSPLSFDSGCDFGSIEFQFVALNGNSPEVTVNGSTINLFPGSKPFGAPICDEIFISDRNIKDNLESVDEDEILERVSRMPIEYWNYIDRERDVRHIGPMAQDFHSAFNVGNSDRHIHSVDANGVNLASIKALYKRLREKDEKIATLEADLKTIKEKLGLPS